MSPNPEKPVTQAVLATCLNEWMRRYIQDPQRFEAECTAVLAFIKDQHDGVEPDYGTSGAAYLQQIAADLGLQA